MEPQNKIPKADIILKDAFAHYKTDLGLIVGIFAIPFVFAVIKILNVETSLNSLFGLLAGVASYVAPLTFLYVLCKKPKINGDFVSAYVGFGQFFWSAVWISLLTALAFFGGLIFFIVPGIIVGLLLLFSNYVYLSEGKRGLSALVKSWYYVRGSLWDLVGKYVFFALITILPSIFISTLSYPYSHVVINPFDGTKEVVLPTLSQIAIQLYTSFVTLPLSILYSYKIFKTLSASKSEVPHEEAAKIRIKIIILSVIGLIAILALLISIIVLVTAAINGQIQMPATYRTASAFYGFINLFKAVR